MTKKPDFQPPPILDLRQDNLSPTLTIVIVHAEHHGHAWIHAGDIELTERAWSQGRRGFWVLDIKLRDTTDDEHDTAVALRLGLTGVAFRMASGGRLWLDGFIAGDDPSMFRVPEPGWNQLEGATKCTRRDCRGRGVRHVVVAEDRYIPPPNFTLFESMRGLHVEIITGVRQ